MSLIRFAIVISVLVFLSACVLKRPLDPNNAYDNAPTAASQALLSRAETCLDRADDATRLNECREQYEGVLVSNPGDYLALARLSTINTLIGTAYTDRSSQKSERFQLAMDYAERAMLTNPEFRLKIERGIPLWEAVDTLEEAEVEAMFYWVTALQYDFREGMNLPSRIINVSWLKRALLVLDRIEEVAPHFGGGGVKFARAICYYVLPESYGGSEQQGTLMMQAAVDENSDWLLPRWARAKYYYDITDQPEKKREELRWVASQDPTDYLDPYAWRMHFIANAEEMLK